MVRGKFVVRDGELVGQKGAGSDVPRKNSCRLAVPLGAEVSRIAKKSRECPGALAESERTQSCSGGCCFPFSAPAEKSLPAPSPGRRRAAAHRGSASLQHLWWCTSVRTALLLTLIGPTLGCRAGVNAPSTNSGCAPPPPGPISVRPLGKSTRSCASPRIGKVLHLQLAEAARQCGKSRRRFLEIGTTVERHMLKHAGDEGRCGYRRLKLKV